MTSFSSLLISSSLQLTISALGTNNPQGSSHATGGILCGHVATYYSPADEENTIFNALGTMMKLTAKIFRSNLDPLNLNHDNMVPSSKVTIKMNPNLGPVLDNISQCYPAIKGVYD